MALGQPMQWNDVKLDIGGAAQLGALANQSISNVDTIIGRLNKERMQQEQFEQEQAFKNMELAERARQFGITNQFNYDQLGQNWEEALMKNETTKRGQDLVHEASVEGNRLKNISNMLTMQKHLYEVQQKQNDKDAALKAFSVATGRVPTQDPKDASLITTPAGQVHLFEKTYLESGGDPSNMDKSMKFFNENLKSVRDAQEKVAVEKAKKQSEYNATVRKNAIEAPLIEGVLRSQSKNGHDPIADELVPHYANIIRGLMDQSLKEFNYPLSADEALALIDTHFGRRSRVDWDYVPRMFSNDPQVETSGPGKKGFPSDSRYDDELKILSDKLSQTKDLSKITNNKDALAIHELLKNHAGSKSSLFSKFSF